ncbi:MAG: hypothetical protein ACR2NP_06630 [Pirellulaceae bacterium]
MHPKPANLDPAQLAALQSALHDGSLAASRALATWLGKPSVVEIDSLQQLSLNAATGVLSNETNSHDEPVCCCCSRMSGALNGYLILAFDDSSGLALADLVENVAVGTHTSWTELATSAALETANILSCAFLNSLWDHVSETGADGLLPSPPQFCRDYAESVLQFVVMDQASTSDQIIMANTQFEIDGASSCWTMLFVPDPRSLLTLSRYLPVAAPRTEKVDP